MAPKVSELKVYTRDFKFYIQKEKEKEEEEKEEEEEEKEEEEEDVFQVNQTIL